MVEPIAEKVVRPSISPEHLEYNPSVDLVVLVTTDERTEVYRLNGERVFKVHNKQGTASVRRLRWKPNGHTLATAYSNRFLSFTNAQTGKAVHHIDYSGYSASQICCLGWGFNFTETHKVIEQIRSVKGELTLHDVISFSSKSKAVDPVPDLPLDLAFLDVELSLPKLSPLSAGGIEDDVFHSRASLETLFQSLTTGSTDSADVLVVGFEDGTVHLSIYDFFEIGTFDLQQAVRGLNSCKPFLHSSHPLSSTHFMLVVESQGDYEELYIVPLDLRLLFNTGRYLTLLASKTTQLRNVVRYIHQAQIQMYSDFKAAQDLPRRFIGNIEETLQEQSDCDWVQAAYHLVVTGHCYPAVKEWLVDQLGERGHKRWDKATNTGYESVQRLAHENLLPALERLTVIVSRLRGLSQFQVSNVTLGLSTQELDNVLDTVCCLQLVAHRILMTSGSELRQFQAFSGWLRQEIDRQATYPNSSEATEKDINVDYASTLAYIQGPMTQSRLIDLFNLRDDGDANLEWDLAAEGRSLFELYKKEYRDKVNVDPSTKRLPGLDALVKHLSSQCETVFDRIAETQRRNVRFGGPESVGAGISLCKDMVTIVETSEHVNNVVTYVVLGPRIQQCGIRVYRITTGIENGISSTKHVEDAFIRTASWTIKDVKIADDDDLLIAASDQESSRLLRITYRKSSDRLHGLQYRTLSGGDRKEVKSGLKDLQASDIDLSNTEICKACTWLEFPVGVSWTPERLTVNGRKGRRVVCVLAQDRLHYRIYALDSSVGTMAAQDAGTEGTDEMIS